MKKQKDKDRISEIINITKKFYSYKKRKKYNNKEILKKHINDNIRSSITSSIRKQYWWHWENLVGYTLEDLIKHLKKTMPKGYTWQDYLKGKLHIDHKIPIRAFVFNKPDDEEFKQCWSLDNLRLLPAKNNESKGDKILNPILLRLLINQK